MMDIIATDVQPKEYLYSEIFYSPQGEGHYTGRPTVWVRFFLCNLTCDGFGQIDPTDKSTYELPYRDFDLTGIDNVEQLPVFSKGCDSSYSWSKRYKHLAKRATAGEIASYITDAIRSESNPDGLFTHPVSNQQIHLAFTGGEPMLHQNAMIDIMRTLKIRETMLDCVTIETNGTKPMTSEFKQFISTSGLDVFMSVSPKLFNVSGELTSKAIKPEVVYEYSQYAWGQLKFVMSPSDAAWNELNVVLPLYKHTLIGYDVWIMPVGATDAGQAQTAADVAVRSIKAGYNVSGRVHLQIFGNAIGT